MTTPTPADALDEHHPHMEAMGRIMRLVHEAAVTSQSQGQYNPAPVARAILAEFAALSPQPEVSVTLDHAAGCDVYRVAPPGEPYGEPRHCDCGFALWDAKRRGIHNWTPPQPEVSVTPGLRTDEVAWVKASAREVDLVPGGIFDIAHRAILALEAAALAESPVTPEAEG